MMLKLSCLTLIVGRVCLLWQWARTRWRGGDRRCTVSHCNHLAPGLDEETPLPTRRVHHETYCSCGTLEEEPYLEPAGDQCGAGHVERGLNKTSPQRGVEFKQSRRTYLHHGPLPALRVQDVNVIEPFLVLRASEHKDPLGVRVINGCVANSGFRSRTLC